VAGLGRDGLAQEGLQPRYRRMRAFALSVGIRIENKYRFKKPLEPGDEQVVHHAVAVLGGEDFARFGVQSHKTGGAGGAPGVLLQCLGGISELVEQTHLVPLGFARAAFAAPPGPPGPVQRGKTERMFGCSARRITLRRAQGERCCRCRGRSL
jgi:hypothetical protein